MLPKGPDDRVKEGAPLLYAANKTRIKTYGSVERELDLGIGKKISWKFIIADVPYPIIGADLLLYHGLLPDLVGHGSIERSRIKDIDKFVYT